MLGEEGKPRTTDVSQPPLKLTDYRWRPEMPGSVCLLPVPILEERLVLRRGMGSQD